jgi:UDP-N-acetyl-D-mannosaminuronate dehydrogenase
VTHTDPYVPDLKHGGHTLETVPFEEAVAGTYDCAVVATDHKLFDFERIGRMPLVVDTRNAIKSPGPNVFRL